MTTATRHSAPDTAPARPTTPRRHAMPRPRHSALFWAAHIGGVMAWMTIGAGLLLYAVAGQQLGRNVATCGVLGVTTAGCLAVAGSRRHPGARRHRR